MNLNSPPKLLKSSEMEDKPFSISTTRFSGANLPTNRKRIVNTSWELDISLSAIGFKQREGLGFLAPK
jgi:hypothetical protein